MAALVDVKADSAGQQSSFLVRLMWQVGLLALFLLWWELAVIGNPSRQFWISRPSLIANRLVEEMLHGRIFYHVGLTMAEAVVGLLAGAIIGIALGMVLGTFRAVGDIFEPFIMAINSIPRIALAPFMVMYFGIGFLPKAVLAFSLVVVVVMLSTIEGIRSVDPLRLNTFRVMRATRWEIFAKCLLPNSVPYIITSIRISVSLALIGALVGEFIAARGGIGYLITEAAGAFDVTGMIVPLFLIVVVAVLADYLLRVTERRMVRWRKPLQL